MPVGTAATFLVVEDDPLCARAFARSLRALGDVQTASSVQEAADVVVSAEVTGMVLDICLGDESGLDFLQRLREVERAFCSCPRVRAVLVVTGVRERHLHQRGRDLGDWFRAKPLADGDLGAFARLAIAAHHLPPMAAELVGLEAARLEMSAMEVRLLALQVLRMPRKEWPEVLGVSRHTIHTHVHRMLQKANAPRGGKRLGAVVSSIEELADPLWRAWVQGSQHPGIT